jgi:hypothetical protein
MSNLSLFALAGAAGSVSLTLYVGRHNNSRLLMLFFAGWVLSPFVALVWASLASKSWLDLRRVTLYSVVLVITLGSLLIYGYVAFGPPRAQTAFVFLVVPAVSWLLIAIALPMAAVLAGRR